MTQNGDHPPRLPKRFYAKATAEGGAILLDGKLAKTRAGNPLAVANAALMEAIAAEFEAQSLVIDFRTMPMTRFAMSVIDLAGVDAPVWREAIIAHLKSDLLCYRACEPAALVARQAAGWDPLIDWASTKHGISLTSVEGDLFIDQPASAIASARAAVEAMSAERLLGTKSATEIAGSAVIGLALADGAFDPVALFDASRIDEEFQVERWGVDEQAVQRAAALRREFLNVARYLSLV